MNQFLNKSIVEAEDFKRQKISDGNVSQGGETISDGNGSAQSATDETSGGSDDEGDHYEDLDNLAYSGDGSSSSMRQIEKNGNRKRIPAPMWLQASGPKHHSDVQLKSGENLASLKRKYKQSLCLYCAEFNKKSPWAVSRSRKYEHEIFNKHEKSKHHKHALSELNKSFGMTVSRESGKNSNERSSSSSGSTIDSNDNSNDNIGNDIYDYNGEQEHIVRYDNYSTYNPNMANVQNSPHNILMNGHNRIETGYNTNDNTYNINDANIHIVSHNISEVTHHPNTDDNPGMNIYPDEYDTDDPAHEHALMLANIANGGKMIYDTASAIAFDKKQRKYFNENESLGTGMIAVTIL
eukprot:CAMPEP_0119040208 /NCGR_PEP_ID=MMETSP1177-20130426/10069_1 /TAXON_ID=2985 /ORGANISM="Ochromonas sp, Strain CCMP1899" /LENGTH=350 /DNA_ID=CAMNT_0007005031 /DNA_START=95 /DNA_END=1148 /DNA_ORIENTATION=-